MNRLLTTAEVGRVLGLTPASVRALADQGRIAVAIRTESGIRLFAAEEVDRIRSIRAAKVAERHP